MEFSHFVSSYYPDPSYGGKRLFADMVDQATTTEAPDAHAITSTKPVPALAGNTCCMRFAAPRASVYPRAGGCTRSTFAPRFVPGMRSRSCQPSRALRSIQSLEPCPTREDVNCVHVPKREIPAMAKKTPRHRVTRASSVRRASSSSSRAILRQRPAPTYRTACCTTATR